MSEDQIIARVSLYYANTDKPLSDIAALFEISARKANWCIDQHRRNVARAPAIRERGKTRRLLSVVDRLAIIELWQSGVKGTAIAAQYGVTPSCIQGIRLRHGLEPRGKGRRPQ